MQTPKQVTHAALVDLLEELGFQNESVGGSHHAFRHRASDTLILLDWYTPHDFVRTEDLVSVRRHLDFRGLLDAAAFDRRFPQATATETPS